MELRYLDAHCHVQFEQYDFDRDEVIAEMRSRGVGGIVVGCDLESSRKAVALAQLHDHLWAAIGLHPNHETDEWFEAEPYRELAKNPKVVAIGECGLDYFRSDASEETKTKQKNLFKDHVALAMEFDKPLIIHSRPSRGTNDAYRDLIALLKEERKVHPTVRGDVHFFVGGEVEQSALNELGFTTSFTAVVTFARDYDRVIRAARPDMILAETDSPFVPPLSRPKSSRNDPLAVIDVVEQIAEIRGEDVDSVRAALLANAERVFAV